LSALARLSLSAIKVYKGDMAQEDGDKMGIQFVLIPDSQVLARLLPIVSELALFPPIENEEVKNTYEGPEEPDSSKA
jgi:hypothetical protein